MAATDVATSLPLLLSVDVFTVCIEGGLEVGQLFRSVGVALCEGVDEATPSAGAVVVDSSIARIELADTADACAVGVVSVIDVSEEAVEPAFVKVDE